MSDGVIRSGRKEDIEQVLGLWVSAGALPSVTDSAGPLRLLLANDREALLLAERNGDLLGSLIAAFDGWRASVYRLAVDPDHRRQGIAAALVAEGERRLQARGAIRFTAILADSDPVATAFWSACGYTRQQDRARFTRTLSDQRSTPASQPGHPESITSLESSR